MVLELLSRTSGLSRWRIDRALVLVGRSSVCTLQLADESVSRCHCSLVTTPDGLWVVDLLGREGVRVNGEVIRSARLGDGDDLRVGRFLIRLRYESSPGPAACFSLAPGVQASSAPGDMGGLPATPNLPQVRSQESGPTPPRLIRLHPSRGQGQELAGANLVDALLAPLVYQLGEVQRQFSDQLAQAVSAQQKMSEQLYRAVTLVEAMGTLHRDQRVQVRKELKQIHRLSHELKSLEADPAFRTAAERLGPLGPDPGKASGAADAREEAALAAPHEGLPPQRAAVSPGERPDHAGGRARGSPSTAAPRPDASIHSAINQRVREIHSERQTRWQRILHLMKGR
jgi:hypothetical protein